MGSRLRYHRKRAGLSQSQLAHIVGSIGARQVAKHENFRSTPSIIAAIGYEVALNVSIAALFPGLYETVQQGVEQRLLELERRLQRTVPKGRRIEKAAQQLVWMCERRQKSDSTDKE